MATFVASIERPKAKSAPASRALLAHFWPLIRGLLAL